MDETRRGLMLTHMPTEEPAILAQFEREFGTYECRNGEGWLAWRIDRGTREKRRQEAHTDCISERRHTISIFHTIYHITPQIAIPTRRSIDLSPGVVASWPDARAMTREDYYTTAPSFPLVLAPPCFRHLVGLERS